MMKKIIIGKDQPEIRLALVDAKSSVFAYDKKTGVVKGMVVYHGLEKGWATLVKGGSRIVSDFYQTHRDCIQADSEFYDFFVED